MKVILALMLGMVLAFPANAAGPHAVRKTVESSMRITGEVSIAADGSVEGYSVDKPERLPVGIKALLARNVPAWRFEPVIMDGQAVAAKARMGIQVVARKIGGEDSAEVTIRGTAFQEWDDAEVVKATDGGMKPPSYPRSTIAAGASGTVFVLLRLNADGTVAQAHCEQVDMTVISSEAMLDQWRGQLAQAALYAAKKWTFTIAPAALAKQRVVTVRVPVDFSISDDEAGKAKETYGTWRTYVPGRYAPAPWNSPRLADDMGAMTPGRPYLLDSGIKRIDTASGT